jgi:hypothetical protein
VISEQEKEEGRKEGDHQDGRLQEEARQEAVEN